MSYIVTDLQSKLRTQIGDPNLDSTVMLDALNYTEQNIFNTFDLTLNSGTQSNSVTSGTSTLASSLPTDYQRLRRMRITSPTTSAADITDYFMNVDDFRTTFPSVTNTGAPREWTYWTSVEFSTVADQTYTISIDYIKSVPLLSAGTDVPTIPQSFEELLILGAKMRIYEQKEDFDYANQFTNRYADLLEAFTTRYSTRQVDLIQVIPGARFRARSV